jgi:classical protein kinase C
MLPLGRKNARKCSECDVTCHANCAHLVPDFCGMSMETANQLLRDWRDINKARGGKVVAASRQSAHAHPAHQYQQAPVSPPLESPTTQLGNSMDRLMLTEAGHPGVDPFPGRQQTQSPSQERFPSDSRYPSQAQQTTPYTVPQNVPPGVRPPPGARIPIPPGYPIDQQILSPPGRPASGVYEQAPQVGPEPAGYQVCSLIFL